MEYSLCMYMCVFVSRNVFRFTAQGDAAPKALSMEGWTTFLYSKRLTKKIQCIDNGFRIKNRTIVVFSQQ